MIDFNIKKLISRKLIDQIYFLKGLKLALSQFYKRHQEVIFYQDFCISHFSKILKLVKKLKRKKSYIIIITDFSN